MRGSILIGLILTSIFIDAASSSISLYSDFPNRYLAGKGGLMKYKADLEAKARKMEDPNHRKQALDVISAAFNSSCGDGLAPEEDQMKDKDKDVKYQFQTNSCASAMLDAEKAIEQIIAGKFKPTTKTMRAKSTQKLTRAQPVDMSKEIKKGGLAKANTKTSTPDMLGESERDPTKYRDPNKGSGF